MMKHTLLAAAGFALAATLAPAAYATDFTAADMNIVFNLDGTVSADFGNSGIAEGDFEDTYTFTLPESGLGSGGVTTSSSKFHGSGDIRLDSVTVNGIVANIFNFDTLFDSAGIANVPVVGGVANKVIIKGHSYGNASYGANATFVPQVPEAATWAMMLVGFGFAGAGMRASRRSKVAFG